MDHYEQKRFNKELASSYNSNPKNSEVLAGQDVNTNIIVQSNIFIDVLGMHWLDNRNYKGKDLLFLPNFFYLECY